MMATRKVMGNSAMQPTKNNNSPQSEMLCLHRLRVEDNNEDQNPSLDSCSDNTPSRAWSWIKASVELCKYGFNSSGKHVIQNYTTLKQTIKQTTS